MQVSSSARGKVKPAKMVLRINGEEYMAYGLLYDDTGYTVFEVEVLVRKNNDGSSGNGSA